jgi:hypothetical protein
MAELSKEFAETFPNWPNFAQNGAQKTNHRSNFGQLGSQRKSKK